MKKYKFRGWVRYAKSNGDDYVVLDGSVKGRNSEMWLGRKWHSNVYNSLNEYVDEKVELGFTIDKDSNPKYISPWGERFNTRPERGFIVLYLKPLESDKIIVFDN